MSKYPGSYKKDDPRRNRVEARFWNKVTVPDNDEACWEWLGNRLPYGYGHIKIEGKQIKAHRWSYEYINGPIPNGLLVLHRCDNPPCVRPDHLFLGTHSDNILDALAKGRLDPVKMGLHNAKLSEHDVIEIRNLFASTIATRTQLAERYGVTRTTIEYVTKGTTWQHVGGPIV